MMTQCPRCGSTVLPMSDGACPSCRKVMDPAAAPSRDDEETADAAADPDPTEAQSGDVPEASQHREDSGGEWRERAASPDDGLPWGRWIVAAIGVIVIGAITTALVLSVKGGYRGEFESKVDRLVEALGRYTGQHDAQAVCKAAKEVEDMIRRLSLAQLRALPKDLDRWGNEMQADFARYRSKIEPLLRRIQIQYPPTEHGDLRLTRDRRLVFVEKSEARSRDGRFFGTFATGGVVVENILDFDSGKWVAQIKKMVGQLRDKGMMD